MKRLPTLCAHTYVCVTAVVVNCDRCGIGWDRKAQRCNAYLGVEHLPLVPASDVLECPMASRCQHQVQETGPCKVRARGLVCESALVWGGMSEYDAANHPLGFNAQVIA